MSDLLSHLSLRALSPGATVLPRISALFESIAEPAQAPIGETESFLEETREIDSEESRSIRKGFSADSVTREEPARPMGRSNAESYRGSLDKTKPVSVRLSTNSISESERGESGGYSRFADVPASSLTPPVAPVILPESDNSNEHSTMPVSADNLGAPRAATRFQVTEQADPPHPASPHSPPSTGPDAPPRVSAAKPVEKASLAIDSSTLGHVLKQLRAGQAVHHESEDRRSAPVMPQPSSKPVTPPIAIARVKPPQAEPVIEVSIGRIEVHTPAQRASPPRPPRGGSSVMSLEQYLRLRNGGRR